MKKAIVSAVLGFLLASNAIAEVAFGVLGSLGPCSLSIDEKTEKTIADELSATMTKLTGQAATSSVSHDAITTSGFSFFLNYNFPYSRLGIQFESGFLFNNGTELSCKSKSGGINTEVSDKLSYTTMELPVLFTCTINKDGFFEFIPHAGFYLSIPIGKYHEDVDTKITNTKTGASVSNNNSKKGKIDNTCIIGTLFGADFAFNFTKKSALMLDFRFLFDFNKLKSDGEDIGSRSVFLLSAGYRHTLR